MRRLTAPDIIYIFLSIGYIVVGLLFFALEYSTIFTGMTEVQGKVISVDNDNAVVAYEIDETIYLVDIDNEEGVLSIGDTMLLTVDKDTSNIKAKNNFELAIAFTSIGVLLGGYMIRKIFF